MHGHCYSVQLPCLSRPASLAQGERLPTSTSIQGALLWLFEIRAPGSEVTFVIMMQGLIVVW